MSRPTVLGRWPTSWRRTQLQRFSPKGWGIRTYIRLCKPGGPTLGQWAPKTSSIESQQDLNTVELKGYKTDCASQISQALSPKAEAVIFKKPGSEPLADLSLPERQETTGKPPGNKRTRGSLLGGLLTLVMSSAILESSLQTISTRHSTAHQQAKASTRSQSHRQVPQGQLCPPMGQQPPQGAGPVTYEPYGDCKPKTC